jgi:hypothetical protein
MRIRLCDKCKYKIEKGEDYIQLHQVTMSENKRYQSKISRLGDICIKCYKKGWGE